VVLTELLRERGLLPAARPAIDLFVAAPAPEERPAALALAHQLRDLGWRVEYALGHQHLGKQLKLADARGARLALVVAGDERARGAVVVKELGSGAQREVPRAQLAAAITALLGAG
jgi:histidyl-tRNA synthetase